MKNEIKSEQPAVATETETEKKADLKLTIRRVRVSTSVKGGPMPGRCTGSWAN